MADNDKARRKRRLKSHYRLQAKRAKQQGESGAPFSPRQLQPGVRGFFCTSNGSEKFCVREVYNLLNEYALQMYGSEFEDGGVTGDQSPCDKADGAAVSVEHSLQQELASLRGDETGPPLPSIPPSSDAPRDRTTEKSVKKRPVRRFQQIKCPVKGCIFIMTSLDECAPLAEHLMQDVFNKAERKARFTSKLIPVEYVCKANEEGVVKCCRSLINSRLCQHCSDTFSVVFRSRHHCPVGEYDLRRFIVELMGSLRPSCRHQLRQGRWCFVVEGMANTLLIGLVLHYYELQQFNLQRVVPAADQQQQSSATEHTPAEQVLEQEEQEEQQSSATEHTPAEQEQEEQQSSATEHTPAEQVQEQEEQEEQQSSATEHTPAEQVQEEEGGIRSTGEARSPSADTEAAEHKEKDVPSGAADENDEHD